MINSSVKINFKSHVFAITIFEEESKSFKYSEATFFFFSIKFIISLPKLLKCLYQHKIQMETLLHEENGECYLRCPAIIKNSAY